MNTVLNEIDNEILTLKNKLADLENQKDAAKKELARYDGKCYKVLYNGSVTFYKVNKASGIKIYDNIGKWLLFDGIRINFRNDECKECYYFDCGELDFNINNATEITAEEFKGRYNMMTDAILDKMRTI